MTIDIRGHADVMIDPVLKHLAVSIATIAVTVVAFLAGASGRRNRQVRGVLRVDGWRVRHRAGA